MNAANHQKFKRSYLEKLKLYGKSISTVNRRITFRPGQEAFIADFWNS